MCVYKSFALRENPPVRHSICNQRAVLCCAALFVFVFFQHPPPPLFVLSYIFLLLSLIRFSVVFFSLDGIGKKTDQKGHLMKSMQRTRDGKREIIWVKKKKPYYYYETSYMRICI